MLLPSRHTNKNSYKQFNTCLCYLLQNIHHDPVSGWLMLASFFYKTHQYDISIELISYALSKCTMEKICNCRDISDVLLKQMGL